MIRDLARVGGKAVFAAADLFLGPWPGPRILIYHQVGENSGRQMEVTREVFEAQLTWLVTHGTVVGLEEGLQKRGDPASRSMFVISFDDGYADLYEVAFPLMEREGLPFTLYLSTEHVETGQPRIHGGLPLTWDHVDKMAQSGLMTLGSHTHSHRDLRHASMDQVEDELDRCDELISKRVGISARHFAYPWGYWSPLADVAVRRRYASAVLGGGGPITASTDRYLVHRLPIQRSDGLFFFRRKAKRGMRLEERARRVLRRYRGP